jgi:hypothetical protein
MPDTTDRAPGTTDLTALLAESQRIADALQFATTMAGRKPDFTFCGGPLAEDYWEHFTPARITSLLAAVKAVLELHKPGPVRHSYDLDLRCEAHDWTKHSVRAFEEVQACPACSFREYRRCAHCREDEWPCPTIQAITRELGKGAGDGH